MLPKPFLVEFLLVCLSVAACNKTQTVSEQKSQESQSQKNVTVRQEETAAKKNELTNGSQTQETDDASELREIDYDSTGRVLSTVGESTDGQFEQFSRLFNQMLDEKATKKCLKERDGLEKDRIRESISLLQIDLNDDGLTDYIINNSACGGSANFPTFIYETEKNKTYKSIFLGDINDVEVTKHKTNGFYDLIAATSVGAGTREITVYKYRNGRYEYAKCGIAKTVETSGGEDVRQITSTKCAN